MRVTNGTISLHVREDGDPSAPPILLLHGIVGSGPTWDWIVPDLVERFRVLRLDFRGHGESDRAPGQYHADGYVSVTFDLLTFGATACYELLPGRVAVLGCGGFELGVLRGRSAGVTEPETGAGLWVAPSAEARLSWRVTGSVALVAQLGLVAPILRPAYVIDGLPGTIHQTSAVTGRGALGLEFTFWP